MIPIAIFCQILASAICFWLFLERYRARSPFQVFFAILLCLQLLPGLFDNVGNTIMYHQNSYRITLSEQIYVLASVNNLFVMLLFLIFGTILFKRQEINIDRDHALGHDSKIFFHIILILAISLIAYIIYKFGIQRVALLSFVDIREGNLSLYNTIINYLSKIIIGMPAFYLLYNKSYTMFVIYIVFFVGCFLLLGGTRQNLVCAILATIIIYINLKKYNPYTALFIVSAIFLIGIDIFDYAKIIRNTSGWENRIDVIINLISGNAIKYNTSSEIDLRLSYYYMFNNNFESKIGNFEYLQRTLLFWLPSYFDIFEIKPSDTEYIIHQNLLPGRIGSSHPTFFGAVYFDSGLFSIPWIFIFCGFIAIFEKIIREMNYSNRIIFWCIGIYVATMTARGSIYAPIVVSFFCIIIFYIQKIRVGEFRYRFLKKELAFKNYK